MIRLAVTSKRPKQSRKGTIINVIVIYRLLIKSPPRFYYKIKRGRIKKVRSSVTNGFFRTFSKPLPKLVFALNKQGKALRKKYNFSLLKPFFSDDSTENGD